MESECQSAAAKSPGEYSRKSRRVQSKVPESTVESLGGYSQMSRGLQGNVPGPAGECPYSRSRIDPLTGCRLLEKTILPKVAVNCVYCNISPKTIRISRDFPEGPRDDPGTNSFVPGISVSPNSHNCKSIYTSFLQLSFVG